jgi:acyl-CoA synthetase (AMP-forming)/AMP-acid ligase II
MASSSEHRLIRETTDRAFRCGTLLELLRWRASEQPERRAYTFLRDGQREEAHLTYEELDRGARCIAARLQHLNAGGERVLLLYPSGLDYIAAFFGCLYAGAIAVPVYPPRPNRSLDRLQAIVDDAGPRIALTTAGILSRTGSPQDTGWGRALQWQPTDVLTADAHESAAGWKEPRVVPETLAFLQYTSGSTTQPRGVMVSHHNLLCNNRMVQQAFEQTEESTFVGWLPLFHDMGLIGNVLQPLFLGSGCVLMAPEAFLMRPFRWLSAVSRYKAHTSGAPDFAYDLCARKVTAEQRATLDLSGWEVAFCGAEPVRSSTVKRFAETFAECGFRRQAFYPCYGLAESTLFVSGGLKTEAPVVAAFDAGALERDRVAPASPDGHPARVLVGCGRPWQDEKILIADPESSTLCAAESVGEIWVSGSNVAHGYWHRPEETDRAFHAYVAETGEGPFLRTGDLGFFAGGELFIAGRLKDLIVTGGRNHYPEDIEQTVESSHPAVRPGCCAAFGVDQGGQERLVVAVEADRGYRPGVPPRTGQAPVPRPAPEDHAVGVSEESPGGSFLSGHEDILAEAIRRAVAEQQDLRVHTVLLLKPGSLPRTSSGKIQRHLCRAGFLAGTLSAATGR